MSQAPASSCRAQRTREKTREKTLAIVVKAALDGLASQDIQHRVEVEGDERSSSFFGSLFSSITSCFTSTTSKSSDDPDRLSISCNLDNLFPYQAQVRDCTSLCASSGQTLYECCIVSAPTVPEVIRQSVELADGALPKAISPIARPNTPSSTAETSGSPEDDSLRFPCVYAKCEYSAYNDEDRIQHGKDHDQIDMACSRLASFVCHPFGSACVDKLNTSNMQIPAFGNNEFRPSVQKDDSRKPRTGYRCPNSDCAASFLTPQVYIWHREDCQAQWSTRTITTQNSSDSTLYCESSGLKEGTASRATESCAASEQTLVAQDRLPSNAARQSTDIAGDDIDPKYFNTIWRYKVPDAVGY